MSTPTTPAAPPEITAVPRTIIENKLLEALQDEDTVAILVTKLDLILLIKALAHYNTPDSRPFAQDLLRLRNAAFPK